MKAAAEASLAPHVWYTSIPDRISITDFVEAVPFPVADALVRIATALRTLPALPPFPGVRRTDLTFGANLLEDSVAIVG